MIRIEKPLKGKIIFQTFYFANKGFLIESKNGKALFFTVLCQTIFRIMFEIYRKYAIMKTAPNFGNFANFLKTLQESEFSKTAKKRLSRDFIVKKILLL